MWIFKNNVLSSRSGISWPARCGGVMSQTIETHRHYNDGRWRPLPHNNSLYNKVNNRFDIIYTIGTAYTVKEMRGHSRDFIKKVSDAKANFCNYHDDLDPTHNEVLHKNGECATFKGRLSPDAMGKELLESMNSGHTWFVRLIPSADMGRSGFGIHPDGGEWGTEGCIGITYPDTCELFSLLKKSKEQKLKVIESLPWWISDDYYCGV